MDFIGLLLLPTISSNMDLPYNYDKHRSDNLFDDGVGVKLLGRWVMAGAGGVDDGT